MRWSVLFFMVDLVGIEEYGSFSGKGRINQLEGIGLPIDFEGPLKPFFGTEL